jgi:hypothetical protein
MINKTILSDQIEITIEGYEYNMEGEAEMYCIINHVEAETDYDYTFTATSGFFTTPKDHMKSWAKENGYSISHIQDES